jgi:hypothetical protein
MVKAALELKNASKREPRPWHPGEREALLAKRQKEIQVSMAKAEVDMLKTTEDIAAELLLKRQRLRALKRREAATGDSLQR